MIKAAVHALGPGPLTEASLQEHIRPLFSRTLARAEIYLANHSLGRPLDRTAQDVQEALGYWYQDLNGAWDPWIEAITAYRTRIAHLIHAPRPDCVVPKTSAGQGLRAVLNTFDRPIRVVTTRGEFDSLDFILKVYQQHDRVELAYVEPDAEGRFQVDDLLAAIDDRTGLVVVSAVMFTSGQVVTGLDRLVKGAHAHGAKVLVDLYHAVGALPVDVAALDADFAVGGCYKYLRGGTGACYLYVHPRHLDGQLTTLDTGWFAKREPFAYQRPEVPQFGEGGDAFLESTPAILPIYQAKAGLELACELGPSRIRTYSLHQQSILIGALAEHGIEAIGAREDQGAFVVVSHPRAVELAKRLMARGVNTDARHASLRLCPDVVTTTEDLRTAADRLADTIRALA
ncbi:aminotransferase class V-fold PLP-dependent enzyme [bacterium]|nr:aminotransferase class V-fold PLP-dependent enzyme [bacterium]